MPPAPPRAAPREEVAADRSSRHRRAAAIAAGAGLAAYALSLLATLPAKIVAPAGSDAAGTAWHGSATLGGAAVRWDFAPAESLASVSLAARWTLDGAATALTGVAHARPFAAPDLSAVRGRADWGLLAAAVPGLGRDCVIALDVALDHASATDVRGMVASLPGACGTPPGPVRAVPRLLATFAGRDGRVTTWTDRAATLATVTLAADAVRLHVTAAGASVLTGAARAGDIEVAR